MELFVEPSCRRLVADRLGVDLEELVAGASLRDDLAADSLDLVELAMALEAEFGIMVPERILDRVRTYGDLVQAMGLLIRARRAAEVRAAEPPLRTWARVRSPAGESGGSLERAGWLTPYAAETIAEDAVRAGQEARLELTVAVSTRVRDQPGLPVGLAFLLLGLGRGRLRLEQVDEVDVLVTDRQGLCHQIVEVVAEAQDKGEHDQQRGGDEGVKLIALESDAQDQRRERRQDETIQRRLVNRGEVDPAHDHAEKADDQQRLMADVAMRKPEHPGGAPKRAGNR